MERGDTIEIAMPLRFRIERSIDNPAIQSIFYGPTLMAVQRAAVGNNLESGLIPFSFFKSPHAGWGSLGRDGACGKAAALHNQWTNAGAVFHRRSRSRHDESVSSLCTAKRAVYGVWFGRFEYRIARGDGLTFLDVLWDEAPFADHPLFTSAVATISSEWQKAGRLTRTGPHGGHRRGREGRAGSANLSVFQIGRNHSATNPRRARTDSCRP